MLRRDYTMLDITVVGSECVMAQNNVIESKEHCESTNVSSFSPSPYNVSHGTRENVPSRMLGSGCWILIRIELA